MLSALAAAFMEEIGRREMLSGVLVAGAVFIGVGSYLGADLNATLRSRRSIAPGVQWLAQVINRASRDDP
jgi:hypothetical protein